MISLVLSRLVDVIVISILFLILLLSQDIADGGGGGVTKMTVRSAQVKMDRVHVPFSLSLNTETSRYSSNIHSVGLSLSSTCDYSIGYYWAVPISTFYRILQAPWATFYQAFHESETELFQGGQSRHFSSSHDKRDFVIDSPVSLQLGQAPREVYPLVVVMVRSGSGPETGGESGQVTALINIVHLRDSACPIPSQVLSTYIRQSSSLTLLRQMFLSDGENSDTESAEESETEDSLGVGVKSKARCVVCQVERVNRVSLPCRHATSCQHCFDRLQARCPMCRALITSFFKLHPDPVVSSTPSVDPGGEEELTPRTGWRSWWRRYNNWVNNVRGLVQN